MDTKHTKASANTTSIVENGYYLYLTNTSTVARRELLVTNKIELSSYVGSI